MKKIFALTTALAVAMLTLTSCGAKPDGTTAGADAKKLSVVTTLYASYDFTRQITGDKADIKLLLPPGAESHSYEPSPQDIIKIENCDVFVYNGGESEAWVKDVLSTIKNKTIKVIAMTDCVNLVEEEVVAGMEPEDEHDDKPDAGEEKPSEHEEEFDEHVWTSPKNAIKIVSGISKAVCEADPASKDSYTKNTEAYLQKLQSLDKSFEEVVKNAARKTVVFGDRFPLRYFVDAYGLDYYAAFPGCSTDTEPSAATVAFLIDEVKKDKIPVVFHIELSNEKMADTICEATGAKKLLFNACHNISKADFEKGVTYLDLMESNVSALKEALN